MFLANETIKQGAFKWRAEQNDQNHIYIVFGVYLSE